MTAPDWSQALAILADPTRLSLLKVLTEGPASVNTLAERLRLSQYNASRHLSALREAGFVEAEHRGTTRMQSIAKQHTLSAGGALDLGFCVVRLDQLKLKRGR